MPDPVVELRSRVPDAVVSVLEQAVDLGFLGNVGLPDQIDHALGFVLAVESETGRPARALDLGSGGGLPGLVLASCWPQCQLTLVEAGERRSEFLQRQIAGLAGFDHVHVVRGRAEALGRGADLRQRFEVVTARSFGPPAVTVECGSSFVVPGGLMVVSEPPEGGETRWPAAGLAELGLVDAGPVRPAGRFGYRLLRKTGETPARYPRRTGIPAKRPLF